jgi:hypothetical protein
MPNYGSFKKEKDVAIEEGDDENRHHAQTRSSALASSVRDMLRSSLVLSGRRCSLRDIQGTTSIPNQVFNLIKNIVVRILKLVYENYMVHAVS